METKEAIEEVKQVFWVKYGKFGNKKADEVIELLQRGEVYKKMWEEDLKNRMRNSTSSAWEILVNAINDIEQKYFSKGVV